MTEEYFQKYFNYLVPKGEHKEASYLLFNLDIQTLPKFNIRRNNWSNSLFCISSSQLGLHSILKKIHDQNHIIWIWALLLHTYRKLVIQITSISNDYMGILHGISANIKKLNVNCCLKIWSPLLWTQISNCDILTDHWSTRVICNLCGQEQATCDNNILYDNSTLQWLLINI